MGEIDLHRVPDKDLLDELSSRPDLIGSEAVEAAGLEIQYVNVGDEAFQAQVNRFLDPDQDMSLGDQLDVMEQFWVRLGYKDMPMPYVSELSGEQAHLLEGTLKEFSGRRVVPAPLLDVIERKSIAERARGFAGSGFVMDRDALFLPVGRFRTTAVY